MESHGVQVCPVTRTGLREIGDKAACPSAYSGLYHREGRITVGETVFFAVGLLLAVYGAADILWRIACRVLSFGKDEDAYLLVPMHGERDDAEYQARRVRILCRSGYGQNIRPILFDSGLTPQSAALTKEVCERLRVDFVDEKEWQDLLETALQEEKKGV